MILRHHSADVAGSRSQLVDQVLKSTCSSCMDISWHLLARHSHASKTQSGGGEGIDLQGGLSGGHNVWGL